MRKKSLSGISGTGISLLDALLDYNRRPGEWKSVADAVFDESLEREMQFPGFVREHDKRRRIDLHLGDVADLDVRRQTAPQQDLLPEEFIQIARRNPDKPRLVHLIDQSIKFLDALSGFSRISVS